MSSQVQIKKIANNNWIDQAKNPNKQMNRKKKTNTPPPTKNKTQNKSQPKIKGHPAKSIRSHNK